MNRSTARGNFGARSQLTGMRAPNQVATETFDRALDGFLRASEDPVGHVQPMLVERPEFVMGHMLVASTAIAAKHPSMLPDAS